MRVPTSSHINLDSSVFSIMPETHVHSVKVTEKVREFRTWTDRLSFGCKAIIRAVPGQILVSERFFQRLGSGSELACQGRARVPGESTASSVTGGED